MKTKENILNSLATALNAVTADQVEVGIENHEMGVTRFANSIIHQNIVKEVDNLWGRVILGKKIGGTSLTSLDKERITQSMKTAYELAQYQKDDPDFKTLPEAEPMEQIEDIKHVTPEERAHCVEKIVNVAKKHGLTAAGAIYTIGEILGIANSLGIRSIGQTQQANIEITLLTDNSSGFSQASAKDFATIDCQALAEIAAEKALLSKNPVAIGPGKYTVLLEEPAVAEFLMFLNYIGFGARSFQEGTSFMTGKLGKKITGDNITIVDDAYDKNTLGFHFDYEGFPKEKVPLIENGIARNVVYDSYYAHKESKKSTGHGIPQPNAFGPYPMNIKLQPGDKTKEEMLASIAKGILLTRFWYTRIIDPDKTLVTGMTRDGTFLIENGKITKGIKNMRYTANILETLANTLMISIYRKLVERSLFPCLLIKDFNFSGKTEY